MLIDNQILQHETLGFLYQSVRVKISNKKFIIPHSLCNKHSSLCMNWFKLIINWYGIISDSYNWHDFG